ncbi:polysaccharide ABC transporter ATP-binding protein [Bacteroidota bacterium]
MSTVLKVENLSKLYRLGEVGTGTITNDLNTWWAKMRGKEDPNALVGQVNDRSSTAESDYVWALKDINFEVQKGDVLGIIGRNGAGKSTLLKILSQITSPTTGSIKSKGRIAALLEVGTGMHPEMTARENIFLNGAILGMSKSEIASKFDEIIDFSGCSLYVDTPIKRFSSGMRVRLGFAVAAFLEPEILIVDEVLAVGDAEFQKKAIGKMKQISKGGERTVLFVSHNMAAVQALCTRAILMNHGTVVQEGSVGRIIDAYLELSADELRPVYREENEEKALGNESLRIVAAEVSPTSPFITEDITVEFQLVNKSKEDTYFIAIDFVTGQEVIAFGSGIEVNFTERSAKISCKVPSNLLNDGLYTINLYISTKGKRLLHQEPGIISFEIKDNERQMGDYMGKINGVVRPELTWVNK